MLVLVLLLCLALFESGGDVWGRTALIPPLLYCFRSCFFSFPPRKVHRTLNFSYKYLVVSSTWVLCYWILVDWSDSCHHCVFPCGKVHRTARHLTRSAGLGLWHTHVSFRLFVFAFLWLHARELKAKNYYRGFLTESICDFQHRAHDICHHCFCPIFLCKGSSDCWTSSGSKRSEPTPWSSS